MESDSVRGDSMDLFDIAVAKKLSGGGSGGGVIHQTYEGTIANIMSQIPNYSALAEALFNGSAFARLTATLGADTATLTVVSNDGIHVQASLTYIGYDNSGITGITEYDGFWGNLSDLVAFERIDAKNDKTWKSTNYKPMASQVPCTLEVAMLD